MKEEDLKYFTMKIPASLKKTIKSHCAKEEISMKEFCIQALAQHLRDQYLGIKTNRLESGED
jgi:predicted HicB family RNase H-like nuclease